MKHRTVGYSLTELMLAMSLSTIILLGLSTIFLTVKRVELMHHDLIEVLDQGRFSVYMLRRYYQQPGTVFSIHKTTYRNSRGKPIMGLYQKDRGKRRQLIALGVYHLSYVNQQIHLGLRSLDRKIEREWVFATQKADAFAP